jgi:FkbM family methyltransferase
MSVVAFILAATDAGPMIVNRLDVCQTESGFFGIGASLLSTGASPEAAEIAGITGLLHLRRQHHGDGVVVMDIGANIGTHALAWGKAMRGWGRVMAVEAQQRVYYALCGNVALNNLFNVTAVHGAVGEANGIITIPELDHERSASFGSLELRRVTGEDIGQTPTSETSVAMFTIDDAMRGGRVDLIKLDIEGMELDALAGAEATVAKYHPVIVAEWTKCGEAPLSAWLTARGYTVHGTGMNTLAVHADDPIRAGFAA